MPKCNARVRPNDLIHKTCSGIRKLAVERHAELVEASLPLRWSEVVRERCFDKLSMTAFFSISFLPEQVYMLRLR